MKNVNRIISAALVLTLLICLCACGEKSNKVQKDANGSRVWYLGESGDMFDEKVELKTLFKDVKDTINPNEIYNSVTYTEDMFYGIYAVNDNEKTVKDLKSKKAFKNVEFSNGKYDVSTVPIALYSGNDYFCTSKTGYGYADFKNNVSDKELAVLEFAIGDETGRVMCSYEVEGNKIKYTELEQTSKSGEDFKYETGKAVFEYEFSFTGPYLTLKSGNDSIKLISYSFLDKNVKKLEMTGYSLYNSPLIEELDYFCSSDEFLNYAVKRDGGYYSALAFKITDNGIITLRLLDNKKDDDSHEVIKQFAYIIQSGNSLLNDFHIIFLDGKNKYYYTDSITQREARIMVADGADVNSLTEEKVKEIAEKKSDLFDDLYKEFESKGIKVTINRLTGEMAMDATVLFGGDSAEITADGKQLLNKFLEAYTSIAYNSKYDGFIKKTLVEGHIAPIAGSTYESGLPLSIERATNVKNYCLSGETGVDSSKLVSSLEAVGLSNSKPVYNNNGEIDMNACRRVSFRFIVEIK